MIPTFNGDQIFGIVVSMDTVPNERDTQFVTQFGANGIESIDGGSRGHTTTVEGFWQASTLPLFQTLKGVWHSYHDGYSYILIDRFGTAWPFTKLVGYRRTTKIYQSWGRGYLQGYEATFLSLI